MGRYIDDILQPGEKVLYSTNAHWMFYLPAIAAWILAIVLFFLSRTTITEGIVLLCLSASAVVAIAALYWTVKAWFHRWTTETDVTNFRIVHKTGFIKRRTFEMSVDKVESVDVNQSILGRILNYGDVTILGVGEGRETIRMIASPLAKYGGTGVRSTFASSGTKSMVVSLPRTRATLICISVPAFSSRSITTTRSAGTASNTRVAT
jgi:hypothetical protein